MAVRVAVLYRVVRTMWAFEQRPKEGPASEKSMHSSPGGSRVLGLSQEQPGLCPEKSEPGKRSEREWGRGGSANVGTLDFTLRWEALNGFGLVFLIHSFS